MSGVAGVEAEKLFDGGFSAHVGKIGIYVHAVAVGA